jgi:FG-GAP-like repeat/Cep192 domain 4/Abnormal spindle-like microcephaly-assoc'd, ASPM-SPD-2-Hydin
MSRSYAGLPTAVVVALCVATLTGWASAQFETRATAPLLPYADAIAVGDFNHGGKLDLAVGIWFSSQLEILHGNGDGTFQPGTYYTISSQPESVYSLAVGDVNGDGNLDIVVASYQDASVAVLLGKGDGTFQPPVNYSTPIGPYYVGLGDFNGDHTLDILTLEVSGECRCLSVLLGNGDGTFQEPAITTVLPRPAGAIGIGDFNGDGKLDVAAAESTAYAVDIFLGNGDGTFRLDGTYPVVDNVSPVTVADLRGNGKLDLVIPGGGEGVGVLLGNGDGTFQPVKYYGTLVASAYAVVAGDVNDDDRPDLVVGASCINTCSLAPVEVFLGNGDGTFQPPVDYPAGKYNGEVAVGDFNGDKKLDVAVLAIVGINGANNDVITLLNTGVVSFSPTTPLVFPTQLVGTTSAPLNVTLTNSGSAALSISSIRVNGPFQLDSSTTCGSSVAAGGNCTLSAVFTPTATGSKTGLLAVSDSASTKLQIIELQGVGTVVSLSPAQLSFPPQKVGTKSNPQTVTITNTSSTAITFSGAKITGVNWKDFSETNTCGSQIGPGANCTVSVTFTPSQTGTRSAVLGLKDSGGGSPQTVPLSGTGT